MVARFTSTQQQSDQHQHSTLIGKVHLPFSNQSSHFLPLPASTMFTMVSLSFYDLQPHNLMPFSRHAHPLSTAHDHTNEHCLPYPTNIWLHSNTISTSNPCVFLRMFPSRLLSGAMHHFHTALLALHNSYEQPLSALEEISCHTATHRTP